MGVPGSLITIRGASGDGTPVERSALTAADGSYLFDGLTDGTYDVIQQQPAAMHDGQITVGDQGGDAGDSRVSSIDLAAAVAATGYNFGELGLRAEYVSVNLHLASNPPIEEVARAVVARGEEVAGNTALAVQIRAGSTVFDGKIDQNPPDNTPTNNPPVANFSGNPTSASRETTISRISGSLVVVCSYNGKLMFCPTVMLSNSAAP